MKPNDWKNERAEHVQTTYYKMRDIMKQEGMDIVDWTVLIQMFTVDYIEAMNRLDDIDTFMDQFKFLIMKAARSKRGYS